MMATIGIYFRGLNQLDTNALRARLNAIAAEFGYTAERGPTAGEGNLAVMLKAIDAGELVVVLLPPEQQIAAAEWLRERVVKLESDAADFVSLALAEVLQTIAAGLETAAERAASDASPSPCPGRGGW